jgi:hypothetical protein
MTFSVSELIVDSDQNVTALLWRYTNSDGSLGGTWTLEKPYGSTPLANVTEAKSVDWLKEQLPNTPNSLMSSWLPVKRKQPMKKR